MAIPSGICIFSPFRTLLCLFGALGATLTVSISACQFVTYLIFFQVYFVHLALRSITASDYVPVLIFILTWVGLLAHIGEVVLLEVRNDDLECVEKQESSVQGASRTFALYNCRLVYLVVFPYILILYLVHFVGCLREGSLPASESEIRSLAIYLP